MAVLTTTALELLHKTGFCHLVPPLPSILDLALVDAASPTESSLSSLSAVFKQAQLQSSGFRDSQLPIQHHLT